MDGTSSTSTPRRSIDQREFASQVDAAIRATRVDPRRARAARPRRRRPPAAVCCKRPAPSRVRIRGPSASYSELPSASVKRTSARPTNACSRRPAFAKKRREPVFVTPARFPSPPVRAGGDVDPSARARRRNQTEPLARDAEPDLALARGRRTRPSFGVETRVKQRKPPRAVGAARNCYVCKRSYHELALLLRLAVRTLRRAKFFASARRPQTSAGALRSSPARAVKIGYQASIMLLRAGAHVIATTRFPRDAAARYAREADWEDWKPQTRGPRARLASHPERRGIRQAFA